MALKWNINERICKKQIQVGGCRASRMTVLLYIRVCVRWSAAVMFLLSVKVAVWNYFESKSRNLHKLSDRQQTFAKADHTVRAPAGYFFRKENRENLFIFLSNRANRQPSQPQKNKQTNWGKNITLAETSRNFDLYRVVQKWDYVWLLSFLQMQIDLYNFWHWPKKYWNK